MTKEHHTMTKDEALSLLRQELESGDPEGAHCNADNVLLAFIRGLGHDEVADAWAKVSRDVGFWYA